MKRRAQTNGMVTLLVLIIVFAIGMGGWWLTQRQRQAEAFRADAEHRLELVEKARVQAEDIERQRADDPLRFNPGERFHDPIAPGIASEPIPLHGKDRPVQPKSQPPKSEPTVLKNSPPRPGPLTQPSGIVKGGGGPGFGGGFQGGGGGNFNRGFVPPPGERKPNPVIGKGPPRFVPVDGIGGDNYESFNEQSYTLTKTQPQNTFSADVNTASYSNIRRMIRSNQLPPKDAVRVAELINYFDYDYPAPKGDDPVGIKLELAACPWNTDHKLLRIALKAKTYSISEMPPRNLVFLVDTSGSMEEPNKLPLAKESLKLLVTQLGENDYASIVTYAGTAGVALEPTSGKDKAKITKAIEGLGAGGSTNGEGGMIVAYDLAKKHFQAGAINRVILMTDGDFNVGISDPKELVTFIEGKRKTGVFLTVLGFGYGNLKDSTMENLARHGNGHYAYVDSIEEARKIFVDQGGAMVTVAKDVKLQIDFDPKRVLAYRLIGYENRLLKNEDFKDDTKDAGEMGSGHTVTALYEIVPVGVKVVPGVKEIPKVEVDEKANWLVVKMRYKQPDSDVSSELSEPLLANGEVKNPSNDFRFAAGVTAWGLILRDSEYKSKATYDLVITEATAGQGRDLDGLRKEFIDLATTSKKLTKK